MKLIENIELRSLSLVEKVLEEKFKKYITNGKQIDFDDLLLTLSRQGIGRATTIYKYTKKEVLNDYLEDNLNASKELELRCRLAAGPLYKVALERFVTHSLISWLTSNNIPYQNCQIPTSSDFSIFLETSALQKINKIIHEIESITNEYDGISLNVDAKSVMGLSNIGDALTAEETTLGKFEAKWNQMSYVPPLLRKARESKNKYLNQKYSVLKPTITYNDKHYLLISIFVCDLICLPYNSTFFDDPFNSLSGSYFDHYISIVGVPNGMLQSNFYDSFFHPGKLGYSKDIVKGFPKYPKDCRFHVMNERKNILKFEHLSNNKLRFRYLNPIGKYRAMELIDKGKLTSKTFFIKDFTKQNTIS